MIGGGGTLSLNPNGVIAGSISGYKWSDLNGNGADNTEPKLSGWTISSAPTPCALLSFNLR